MTDDERRTIRADGDGGRLIPHPHLSTENVQIVMGMLDKDGNQCPELAGLIITDDDGIVGALPGTPAYELGLEKCAELTGYKIDWQHIEQRHRNLAMLDNLTDLAAQPPGDVDGRQRWRSLRCAVCNSREDCECTPGWRTRPTKEK